MSAIGKLTKGDIKISVTWYYSCSECGGKSDTSSVTIHVEGDDDDNGPGGGCGAGCGKKTTLGSGTFGTKGEHFTLALGAAGRDTSAPAGEEYKDAGYLELLADTPSSSLATPSALAMPYKYPGVERIPADPNSTLQQVKVPEGLVQVGSVNNGYSLSIYDKSLVGPTNSAGLYTLQQNATPFVTWTISNPSANTNNLQFIENRGGQERVYLYAYTNSSSVDTWTLIRPDNSYSFSQKMPAGNNNYVRSYELHNADGTLAQASQKSYQYITSLNDVLVTQLTEGSGSATRTTTYTYYDDDTAAYANFPRRVIYPDGNWVYYEDRFSRAEAL